MYLKATPLIDGHNDWAESLRTREGDKRWTIDLREGLGALPVPYNTDITRLRKGMVGGQFWSVYVSADLPGPEQVKETLEQIDLVKQIIARYPGTFELARTAADVRRIHKEGKIASMMGVEGGGQIDESLSVLRAYHDLGAGYLTLTHAKTISWADSATDDPRHDGLTPFGEAVVHELNRIGMLIDLSHVSEGTMKDALRVSKAPVIFSHSAARALDDHPRDVSDEVLKLVAKNGGVVMATSSPPVTSLTLIAAGRPMSPPSGPGSAPRPSAAFLLASRARRPRRWRSGGSRIRRHPSRSPRSLTISRTSQRWRASIMSVWVLISTASTMSCRRGSRMSPPILR